MGSILPRAHAPHQEARPPEGVAALHVRPVELSEAEQQAQAQPWVEMDCLQLAPGRFRGRLAACDLSNGIRVVEEFQNTAVQKAGAMPAGFCTFSTAEAASDASVRFGAYAGTLSATVFFLPGGMEFDSCIPGGVRTRYVWMDQDALIDVARRLAPRRWERPPRDLLALRGADAAAFSAVAGAALAAGAGEPLWRTLTDGLAHLLVAGAAPEDDAAASPGYRARRQAVARLRRARDHIDASLRNETVPTVADLCAATGVSERTLQYMFQDAFGMSPVAYLRALRLNRVRATLRDPAQAGRTVTDIAMRWGFLHLGRFAGDYRRMFGETPAQTRASAACAR